jgi:hypothetical protein
MTWYHGLLVQAAVIMVTIVLTREACKREHAHHESLLPRHIDESIMGLLLDDWHNKVKELHMRDNGKHSLANTELDIRIRQIEVCASQLNAALQGIHLHSQTAHMPLEI